MARGKSASNEVEATKAEPIAAIEQTGHFSPALFRFLEDLRANNEKVWFVANKDRYESEVKAPMLRFISYFAKPLHRISAQFDADPRPVGGSMFRIYRDTRFSRDKSPYKTAASMHFRHRAHGDVHAPGFYLHLEPGNIFAGAGVWRPEVKDLEKIRSAIVARPAQWKKVVGKDVLGVDFELWGDKLARPPRAFDAAHPLIEDLKRKDFVVVTRFDEVDVCRRDFIDRLAARYQRVTPFVKFLTQAMELAWRKHETLRDERGFVR